MAIVTSSWGVRFVCSLVLYPATYGPEDHGSGRAAALRQWIAVRYVFPIPVPDRYPSTQPQNPTAIVELPYLRSPISLERVYQKKDRGNIYKRQRKAHS